ncbi:MAG TPA: ABC transporter permease [Stellaceae bacterium]|nr:ABC transporter permease [Stellaceae bacterium]
MRAAAEDLISGLTRYYFWSLLAWQDVKQRYRRSMIGPFWLTLSMGVMIGMIGVLYAGLFHQEIGGFLPYVAAGIILWTLISSIITESCATLITAGSLIKQIEIPYSVYIYRMVARNYIVLAHNALIWILVALVFGVAPRWSLVALPFSLLLIAANGVWIGLLLSLLCARFRDIPLIMASLVQVAFFVTPIMWRPGDLPGRSAFVFANPFYHFIELGRGPLLGAFPTLGTWTVTLAVTILGWGITFLFFARFRPRLAYWV